MRTGRKESPYQHTRSISCERVGYQDLSIAGDPLGTHGSNFCHDRPSLAPCAAAAMATLSAIRVNSKARDAEERQKQERRRNTLVLVMRHLLDSGYLGALERLQAESHVSLDRFDAADNIDLATIVQEFEEFHEMKFGRRPKLVRRVGPEDRGGGAETTGTGLPPPSRLPSLKSRPSSEEGGAGAPAPASGFTVARERRLRGQASQESLRQEALERRKQAMDAVQPPAEVGGVRVAGSVVDPRQGGPRPAGPAQGVESGGDLSLHATSMPLLPREADRGAVREGAGEEDPNEFFERRVLKPLPAYLQGESRELGLTITKDIFMESPDVRWEDIKGLSQAKRLLKEAVVMPIKYPELFTGILAPWKGILLYGPPGTGKTMLAKAVATECRTTFFNISASTIISKWRGESEKLVRVLFELARYHAPSTIFMDELDALMASRGGDGEHEASRRMKTEILVQMDGLARGKELVFVLAATNMPWELDMAMLRRLEKRIMVPLPEAEGRQAMLESLLGDRVALGVDLADVAARTEGFSGADMYLLAKEAAMRPLRRLMATIDISGDEGPKQALELERVAAGDLEGALSMTKPSAKAYEKQYRDFSDKYGVMAQ